MLNTINDFILFNYVKLTTSSFSDQLIFDEDPTKPIKEKLTKTLTMIFSFVSYICWALLAVELIYFIFKLKGAKSEPEKRGKIIKDAIWAIGLTAAISLIYPIIEAIKAISA